MAHILGQGEHEALDLIRRAAELGAQVGALRGDAGRAGVEMALPRHVAAERDEERRPERELLGAQERRDDDVAPGPQPAVGAQRGAIAQAGPEEHLVDLGQAQLPGHAGVLDRAERRCPGAAGVTGDWT